MPQLFNPPGRAALTTFSSVASARENSAVLRPSHSRFAILRSTMFKVEELRREGALVQIVLRGGGFGHGVGLCQTGALGRAEAGQSVSEILGHYYPRADLVRVTDRSASR